VASVSNVSEILALREAFVQLGRAIAVSDLNAVETTTEALRGFLARMQDISPDGLDRAALEQIDLASADVADLLASRLRAYDMAIAAWREAETET
jgi:hypothetical protein